MQLTKEDLNEISAIVSEKGHIRSSDTMANNFNKLAWGLVTVGIIWIITTVSDMEKELVKSTEQREQLRREVSKLDEFMAKPRFTREDFLLEIQPVINMAVSNKNELERRNAVIEQVNKLSQDIEIIKNQMGH